MTETQSDVTILGGGLAGLALALQCRQKLPKAQITVLEKMAHPVPEATHKVGESTVEVGAYYFADVLGLKQHIVEEQLPKLGLRFFFPHGDNSRIEKRLEIGGTRYAPAASYQLDRGRFENFLGDRCREQGIDFLDRADIKKLQINKWNRKHMVTYSRDEMTQTVASRWVVDASGRRALLKQHLGLQKPTDQKCNAAWFRIDSRLKVDDWSDDPEWQAGHEGKTSRWYSTNHLMGQGYWVWLIPLASGSTSIGIVAEQQFHPLTEINSLEKSLAWLEKNEPQLASQLRKQEAEVQDFLVYKNYSRECQQVFSGHRWGITGEAGFFLDPFYSPGSDFIAFANTFLTDLIWRDLTWRGHRIRAFSYDRIFKKFFHGTASVYRDQYQLFGNPQVMSVKVMWDYLIYWSLSGFIFMQERLCNHSMYMRNVSKLNRLSNLNHHMQDYFRLWHQKIPSQEISGLVNISNLPIIRNKNEALVTELNWYEFDRQFSANLGQMETLYAEIVQQVGLTPVSPVPNTKPSSAMKNAFQGVFDVILPQKQADQSDHPAPLTAGLKLS